MSHPYLKDARGGQSARLKSIASDTKSYSKAKENKPLTIEKPEGPMKAVGLGAPDGYSEKSKPRLDRFKRGGAVKGKTNVTVNIISPGKGGDDAQPVPVPVPVGPLPGAPPMPPPGAMAGGPPPGAMPPPGMIPPGMRAAGGRAYKKGGRVKKADGGDVTWEEGSGRGMLEDRKYAGMRHQTGSYSGPPRKADGGSVGVTGKPMAKTKMAGAGSGQGREEKAEAAKRK
jgi:hypothetical protein